MKFKNVLNVVLISLVVFVLVFALVSCKKDDTTPTAPGGGTSGGLTATPSSVSILVGAHDTVTISGGTLPYYITTQPNSSIATATINNNKVAITGIAAGTTSVVVKDSSSTIKSVTIPITVSTSGGGTGGGSGSLSFNSNQGNFSASGTWNDQATSGSMVGGWRFQSSGYDYLYLMGYKFNSPTNVDATALIFQTSGTLTATAYTMPSNAMFVYLPNMNPADTITYTKGFVLISGSATISSLTASNTQGTFNGTGMNMQNTSQTITVTAGAFNVNYVTGQPQSKTDISIQNRIRETIEKMISRELAR